MSINNEGPEGRNVLSQLNENEMEAIFSNFLKWDKIYNNIDVRFLKTTSEEKENRGIDFLYKLYEPFLPNANSQGVILETKGVRETSLLNITRLTEDIDTLKHKIERLQKTKKIYDDPKIQQYGIDYFKFGVLCYRFRNFDVDEYKKVLMKYQFNFNRRSSSFPTIFVLANDRISAFSELNKKITDIEYFYPHYNNHRTTKYRKSLSLFYTFSDIIPFKGTYKGVSQKCLLTFDKLTPKSLQVLENFCANFNFIVDCIIFAGANYSEQNMHKNYLSDWENRAEKEIKLVYLNTNMDCGEDLSEVFYDPNKR
ncbi:MAG: hypothetical protein ACFFCD_17980 [Promethearchaeota archaeon]